MPIAAYKACITCGATKSLNAFKNDRRTPDQKTGSCKACLDVRTKWRIVDTARFCACGCGEVVMGWNRTKGELTRFAAGHKLRPPQAPRRLRFPEEVAWAAGIFEGEGCFSTAPRMDGRLRYANAAVKMNDEDIIRRFFDVVQVGTVNGPSSRNGGNPFWDWKAGRHEDVEEVALLLAPWLGPRRLVAAATALARDTRRAR